MTRDHRPLYTADDLFLFKQGRHFHLPRFLGAHLHKHEGKEGVSFAVWAPNAHTVSVVGDFNHWQPMEAPLQAQGQEGLWTGFIQGLTKGSRYKYHIHSRHQGYQADKADPFALYGEYAPENASRVWDLDYQWSDEQWLARRAQVQSLSAPLAIYELHLGSWARPEGGDRASFLTYRDLALRLVPYVAEMGFTHVEFMPLMEHPFYGSWGYQTTGYFAPSSRWGTPQDLMFLIDELHRCNIGVILDWVPSHFPSDEFGLGYFDGTHLFEHPDRRLGFQPDWNSLIFDYGRNEVRSFLISSALFWLETYHVDALRVDAVASMLYRDYSRPAGEWLPNQFGGRENLEAIDFLRQLNEAVYHFHPGVQTIAEESTAWPLVSRPTYLGGLGFGMKWDMGWMHDTLTYFAGDPLYRRYSHDALTFRMMYAYSENFVMPLSHDEVVYGKGSLLAKMPGDEWQKFANLRTLFAYMYASPGKKLLFMGSELAPWKEWDHDGGLDWSLLALPLHRGVKDLVRDLNHLYRSESCLHAKDCEEGGFAWVDHSDAEHSVLSFMRSDGSAKNLVLAIFNLTPVPRFNYRVGVDQEGLWREVLNSDSEAYGGTGHGNFGGVEAAPLAWHQRPFSLNLTLPPLACLYFKWEAPS